MGEFVRITASGPLSGVVVEDAGPGMVVVQIVVSEWMVSPEHLDLADQRVPVQAASAGHERPSRYTNAPAWGVRVECRDCDAAFHPDSSPHPDRCQSCAARVDGEVTV